jgi:kynurenine formamidase
MKQSSLKYPQDLDLIASKVNNWKRWGDNDEMGTVNFISAQKVINAAGLVRQGRVIELALALDRAGPQAGAPRRFNPIHFMSALPAEDVLAGDIGIADDVLITPLQAATQWDSLAHISHREMIYGGRSNRLVGIHGAKVNTIRAISSRIVSRGVLIDMPRHFGVDSLEPGQAIAGRDLDAVLERHGLSVAEGDVLLVRTGFLEQCRRASWDKYRDASPGLGIDTIEWLHARNVAAICTDTVAVEVKPSQVDGIPLPFHVLGIVYMGLLLGEMFDMETLAHECAADGVYEFMFVAAPLPVTGGVGSPINPYAIK